MLRQTRLNFFKIANNFFRENMNVHLVLKLSFVSLLFVLSAAAFADYIDSIQLLKISPKDERAIIKTPDGKMQIIKVGDIIATRDRAPRGAKDKRDKETPGPRVLQRVLKVTEITDGRVVLETTDENKETIIIRVENGKQNIERIQKAPVDKPVLYKTQ
jgi:hypothetical protein